ncbi:MAG: RDD family protein [Gammaproteobacteria bacterium]|nr:RDD family protein [Gammaproteobacteria bacterium]
MDEQDKQTNNPYATPEASLVTESATVLADRGTRLGAAIIDGLIMMALVLPVMYVSGYFALAMAGEQPSLATQLGWSLLGFTAFVLVQGKFLAQSGQTIGKKLLKIRIVTLEGDKPEFKKLVGLRYLVPQLIAAIPLVGPVFGLANVLAIFGAERRCIHDYIAGTRVVVCD